MYGIHLARNDKENFAMNNLNLFFEPDSIALIGATEGMKFGYVATKCLLDSKFKIYLVNPNEKEIMGVETYKSVLDIQDDIDLAVIMIPARFVLTAVKECAEKGIKAIIIESAGFSEIGEDGRRLEEEIVEISRKNGMRIIGPNCLGVLDTHSSLSTTGMSTNSLKRGQISVITQSGMLGNILTEWMPSQNVGLSKVISIGNKCDVDEVDLLEYLGNDDRTKVITMYLEGTKDGRRFLDAAKKVTKRKPVLIVKGGRSVEGAQTTASHTGSMAGEDRVYESMFKQAGIIRVDDFEELFSFAKTFEYQPLPKSNRIAIITTSGSLAVLACDECAVQGLKLPKLSEEGINDLKMEVPDWVSVKNPLDLGPSMNYWSPIETILKDENVDSLLVIMVAPLESFGGKDVIDAMFLSLREVLSDQGGKTVLFCTIGDPNLTIKNARENLERYNIPVFTSSPSAVRGIAALYRYKRYLERCKVVDSQESNH